MAQTLSAGGVELLSALYEGPLEEVPFHAFLSRLCEAVEAVNATLILRPPSRSARTLVFTEGQIRGWETPYAERFFALDPFSDLPEGEVKSLLDLVHAGALEQSDFYKEFLQPSDTFHVLGFDVRASDGLEAALRATRGRSDRAFGPPEQRVLAMLVPHVRRIARLFQNAARLEAERDFLHDSLEAAGAALILIDEHARIIRTNAPGAAWLDKRAELQRQGGQLEVAGAGAEALEECILGVIDSGEARELGGVCFEPLPSAAWEGGPRRALVAVRMPGKG